MAKKESAKMKGEEYLKGRRAGVEGTHGASRKGVAEKTALPHSDTCDSGGESELNKCASEMHKNALRSHDPYGDKAITER